MCDLIDLNSPDPRKVVTGQLPSPLIPEPSNIERDKNKSGLNFFCIEKRSNGDDNPFDRVYNETADYVQKKNDPFETVLETVLNSSNAANTVEKSHGIEYNDDVSTRNQKSSDILKISNTLDDNFTGVIDNTFTEPKTLSTTSADHNLVIDLNDAECRRLSVLPNSLLKEAICPVSPGIFICPPSPVNVSNSNQTAMSDSFSESSGSSEENEIKAFVAERISVCVARGQNTTIDGSPAQKTWSGDDHLFKRPKHRRSLSNADKKSPESPVKQNWLMRPRSTSLLDTFRDHTAHKSRRTITSITSINSNPLDVAFLGSTSSSNSKLSNSCLLVEPPRRHFSSIGTSYSGFSNSVKNTAFIRNDGSDITSDASRLVDSGSEVQSQHTTYKDLNLRNQYGKLNSNLEAGRSITDSPVTKVRKFLDCPTNYPENQVPKNSQGSNERDVQLIDVDTCKSEYQNIPNTRNASSTSNSSSDSVFMENAKAHDAVFNEAIILARTFEEIALRSASSYSSGEDLINSQPRWNFDALPLSDEEILVDNLIELPPSPTKRTNQSALNKTVDLLKINGDNTSNSNVVEDISKEMKNMELEFVTSDVSESKIKAATVLLDLEKIVRQENNSQAIMLLESLGRVLGLQFDNNAQLLAACMQQTNDLSKSPKKTVNQLGSNENIKREVLENSHESNGDTELSGILSATDEDNSRINENMDKEINKTEKSIIVVDYPPKSEVNNELLSIRSEKSEVCNNGTENQEDINEREALKLIMNLGKVLSNNGSDSSPLSLLANLGKLLNFATTQLNDEMAEVPNSQYEMKLVKTDVGSQEKALSSDRPRQKSQVKLTRERSFDSAVKPQVQFSRTSRSMSLTNIQRNTATTKSEIIEEHSQISKNPQSARPTLAKDVRNSLAITSAICKNDPSIVSASVKHKLRNKTAPKLINNKGPLKAIVPIGNMHRRDSLGTKFGVTSNTPPKSGKSGPTNYGITVSTPKSGSVSTLSKQSPKTKPVASSTPEGNGSKYRKISRFQSPGGANKQKLSCNISPVTPIPTEAANKQVSNSRGSTKNSRCNRTLSPPKQSKGSRFKLNSSVIESSIPKYGPLVGFQKKSSTNVVKASESPKKSTMKSLTPIKKSPFVNSNGEGHIPSIPLKMMNNQTSKMKPCNLISKLRRSSNGNNIVDKENYA